MTTKDVLPEGLHGLCRNNAKSSSQWQCPGSEMIKSEGRWMWQRLGVLTNVMIWSLLLKMIRDILARSPSASGETSKRRTSSLSRSIEIEKPWSFHKLGCPETDFQVPYSRVNDCVRSLVPTWTWNATKKTKACHTLTGSSTILLLPDYQSKSLTVDITELLIYTCNIWERKIFTATSWPLHMLR